MDHNDLTMLKGKEKKVQDIWVARVTATRYVFIGPAPVGLTVQPIPDDQAPHATIFAVLF